MNKYKEALEQAKNFAAMPFADEVGNKIKKSDWFKTLEVACDKAEQFDYLTKTEQSAKWHLTAEKDYPVYTEELVIATVYRDDSDYPYYETEIVRFYRMNDNNVMWINLYGETVSVYAWKELPSPCRVCTK